MLKNNEKAKMIKSISSLTPMQEGMLYHNVEDKYSTGYVIQSVFQLNGLVEEDYIAQALQFISERYEILREFIMYEKVSKPVQVVLHQRELEFKKINLEHYEREEQKIQLQKIKEADIKRGFDLQKDTLLRVIYIRINKDSHIMIWSHHHIIMDGWCTSLIYGDFMRYYHLLIHNNTVSEIKKIIEIERQETAEFSDYVSWLENQNKEEGIHYFLNLLKDYNEESRIHPMGFATKNQKQMEKEGITLESSVVKRLTELAVKAGVTLNTVMEAAWGILLQKYNCINDVVFGKVVSGRNADILGIENMVGLFINTVPVRVNCTKTTTIAELLNDLQNQAIETSCYDYCALAQIQSNTKQASELIKTIIAFENYYINEEKLEGFEEKLKVEVDSVREQTNYELSLSILADDQTIKLGLLYNPNMYSDSEIKLILKRLEKILHEFITDSQKRISQLETVTKEEKDTIINKFNNTYLEYDRVKSLAKVFEETVLLYQENIAVVYQDKSLTYGQLNEKANILARKLNLMGVCRDDFIAIVADRSLEMFVSIIAVLKAGAAYVPIDPTYPEGRIQFILNDCSPKAVLNYNCVINTEFPVINLMEEETFIGDGSNLNIEISIDNLAYCIYTSGTTGKPKGVMLTHRGVVAMRSFILQEYRVNQTDKVLQFANYIFDASVWEITMSLFTGARLTVIPKDSIADVNQFNKFVEKEDITITLLPPQYYLETDIKNLRILTTGGSATNLDIVNKAKNNMRYVNAYGPTESTVLVTRWENDGRSDRKTKNIPIGKPIPNSRVYIMNEFQMCGIGVSGELCISGDGLAAGYLNNAALTLLKFNDNPYENSKMYRTGDMARWLEDGNIEYLGRIDEQVKIRGFRVELTEIETVIRKQKDIKDVAVVAKYRVNNELQLCAYIVSNKEMDFEEIQIELSKELPQYMIPSYFMKIDKIPLNRSGKLDKDALPNIVVKSKEEYKKPKNEVEEILCQAFETILGLNQVGINDSFYKLGGDSIKAIRVVSKIRESGYEISVKDIMQKQTVKLISTTVKKEDRNQYEQKEVIGAVVSTPIIRDFCKWSLRKPEHFNQSMMINVGEQNAENINLILHAITSYHDILRAVLRNHQLYILSTKESKLFELKAFDFTDGVDLAQKIENESNKIQESFDLEQGPLFKAALFKTPGQNYLMLCAHHLVVDGVSWRIILEDINIALNQIANNQKIKFAQKTASFKAWSEGLEEYRGSDKFMDEKKYWLKAVQQMRNIKLKTDQGSKEHGFGVAEVELNEKDTNGLLRNTADAFHTSINDLLLASLAMSFYKLSNQKQIVIGLEGHGREEIHKKIDIDRTVGWFTNIYPVKLFCDADIKKCIINNKEMLHKVPNHGFGYGLIQDDTDKIDMDVYFNYLGEIIKGKDEVSNHVFSSGDNVSIENGTLGAISLNGIVENGTLSFSIIYDKSKFYEATINQLAFLYKTSLREMIQYCISRERTYKTQCDYSARDLSFDDLESIDKFYYKSGKVIEDIYSLTPLQSGMLFHHMFDSQSTGYIIQNIFEFEGEVQEQYVIETLNLLSQKHDILRTAIYYKNIEKARQVVLENNVIEYESIDLSTHAKEEIGLLLHNMKEEDLLRGFDLQNDSLLRVKFVNTGSNTYKVFWTYHHIIMDGWCIQLILGDFLSFYKELRDGKDGVQIEEEMSEKIKKQASYKDYINWLENQASESGLTYFSEMLSEYEEVAYIKPIGYEIDTEKQMEKEGLCLDQEESRQLLDMAKKYQLTINTILETAYGILLQNYNYTNDVVFGKVVSGRNADIKGIEEIAGLFINTIPVRVKNNQDTTVLELLFEMQNQAIESSSYDYCALTDIQNKMNFTHELIKSLFVFENYYVNDNNLDKTDLGFSITVEEGREQTNYDISLCTKYTENCVSFEILYNPQKYIESEIKRVLFGYKTILLEIINNIEAKVSQIEMVTQEDKSLILQEFNNTTKFYDKKTFIEAFEEQVLQTPDNIAVTFDNESISYTQLNEKANYIATILCKNEVQPNDFVAVMTEKSIQMIAAILSIAKASAVYVPIDISLPDERIETMLKDCRPKVIITYKCDKKFNVPTVNLCDKMVYNGSAKNPQHFTKVSDLLYLIYTSGTTGKPKGVMVENRGILNLRHYFKDAFGISSQDKILQFSNICFDASVWEITMALLHGAELVIPMKEQVQDLDEFAALVRSKKITVATLPPVYYTKVGNMDLRVLITAGSEANQEIVRKTKQRYINAYGPTENTICATHWEYSKGSRVPINIPIGKPIPNVQTYILKDNKLCSIGVPGELCIAGDSLARGYLNMPKMTEQKFVSNPFGEGRLYRSGDLARWLEDGNIEFLGRIDEQVKIRGYRIELGEIEYILRKYADIKDAAVLVTYDKLGDKMLCAYLVSNHKINIDAVRNFLAEKLPSYMLPAFMVQIDSIPLSLNGKLDKKALPDFNDMTTGDYVEPRNELETNLCVIIQDVTGRDKIGIKDNIFELGVNSLKAISIVGRVKKLGIELPIQKIFELTTIESLSNYMMEKEPVIENVKQSFAEIDKLLSANRVDESIKISKRNLKDVVLTGVTGFLGIHILVELLEKHSGNIYCIIRSKDEEDGYNRLKECLSYYYGDRFDKYIRGRVIVISGSIEQKDLMDKLPVKVSTVIHSAAITKHYGFKDEFEMVNVKGTHNILNYAETVGARFIYISTTSVAGEIQKNSKAIEYNETNYYIGQILSASEYTQSKFKAERLVLDSKLKGHDTIIIRVGNLTNRWSDGMAARNYKENRFLNMIKLMVDKGYVRQDLLEYELQFSAVDVIASGVITLTEVSDIKFSLYHLFQVKKVRLEQMVRIFDNVGVRLHIIDKETDIQEEMTNNVNENSFELISGESTKDNYMLPVTKCDFTNWLLEKSGFSWKEPDEAYLHKVIKQFYNNGFWRR